MEQQAVYVTQGEELFQLADRLKGLKEQKKQLEDTLKDINAAIEETNEKMVQIMTQQEIQNFNRAGQLFYLNTRTFASPAAGQQEALYSWLKENGYGDLVKETVYSQTLSAFIKELLEEDDELPEELQKLVNVYEKTIVGVKKAAK